MHAAHLNAQDREVSFGGLDGGRLLSVEERRLDHRQIDRIGQQIPSLAGVARIGAVGQIAADLRAEFPLVRVAGRILGRSRRVADLQRLEQLRSHRA